MTLPAAIAEIAARHDIAYSDRRHSIVKAFKNAHNDRGALLRAYRELAQANERLDKLSDELIEERDRAQDALQDTHLALGGDGEWVGRSCPPPPPDSGDLHLDVPELAREVKAQRDRLRASHAKVFEAGWRTAATWAARADLIFDIGSPAYLEDQAKALADAQHPADACQHERLKCEPDESRIYCADCGVYVGHTP